jgi:Phage tail tube protein, TTP
MTVAIPAAKTLFWVSAQDKETYPSGSVSPTAISKAKPAVLTVTAATPITSGMTVQIVGTGFPELDGKFFVTGTVTTTSIPLLGSDTTNSSGTLTAGTAKCYGYVKNTDSIAVCVSSFSRAGGTVDSVSVGTFCDPTATIPGTATAGTATINGYMDPTEAGYLELVEASEDQSVRYLRIDLPDSKGSIIVVGTFSGMSEEYALGQGISYSLEMGLATKPTYAFAP